MRDGIEAFNPETWREDYDWREAFTYANTIRTATGCAKDGFTLAGAHSRCSRARSCVAAR